MKFCSVPAFRLVIGAAVSLVVTVTAQEEYEFQIIRRGYQILDPVTGHVLPPSLNTYRKGPTRHYKRPPDQKKQHFTQHSEEPSFHQNFGTQSSLSHSGPTNNYFPSHQTHHSDDRHYEDISSDSGYYPKDDYGITPYSSNDLATKKFSFFGTHNGDHDQFRLAPHKVFKKQVYNRPHHHRPSAFLDDPHANYFPSTSSSGSRGSSRRPVSTQPHKYRKKYPYYGRRRKRSPLELLDPRTGRTIQRPIIKYRPVGAYPAGIGSLPLRSPSSGKRSNRNIKFSFGTGDSRSKRRQPSNIFKGYFASSRPSKKVEAFGGVRSTRNIAKVPLLNDDRDLNRFRRPNLGGEYYSLYSGLPVYKYAKKHPHGYHGKRKRQVNLDGEFVEERPSVQFKREAQWVLLDPLTGRTIERGESDVSRPELKVADSDVIPDLVQAVTVHGNDDLFGEFVEDSDDIDAGFRKERNNEDGPDSYEEDLEEDKHRFRYHKKNPYRG